MFNKIKRVVTVGTIAAAMMWGVIIQGSTGGEPTNGGNTSNAGVIVHDVDAGSRTMQLAWVPQPEPPGATIVAGVIVHDSTEANTSNIGDWPPGPYATELN